MKNKIFCLTTAKTEESFSKVQDKQRKCLSVNNQLIMFLRLNQIDGRKITGFVFGLFFVTAAHMSSFYLVRIKGPIFYSFYFHPGLQFSSFTQIIIQKAIDLQKTCLEGDKNKT